MRVRSLLPSQALLFLVLLAPIAASADEAPYLPEDAKFCLQLDFQGLQETRLGSRLIELAREKIQEELSREFRPDKAPDWSKIHEILGFDPFEEIERVTCSASQFENPEESLCVVIEMRETTGNLEGLVLALPGYESEEYGKHQLHRIAPDENVDFFLAIHDGESQGKRIIIASQRETADAMLDHLDGNSRSQSRDERKTEGLDDAFLSLRLLDIPGDFFEEGPPANIAKILKRVALEMAEQDDDLAVALSLTTKDSKQSEQLRQMMQGLTAMISLADSMETEDPDFKKFQEIVRELKTTRDGNSVQVTCELSTERLETLMEEELDIVTKSRKRTER